MESICIRLDSSLSKKIDRGMKEFNYSTKTELIRDAIRNKLKEFDEEREKGKFLAALNKYRGAFKGKSRFKTDEEWHDWRSNEGSKQALEYYRKKFGLNLK